MRKRKRKGARVNGPYPARRGWRVVVVAADGTRRSQILATERAAARFIADVTAELAVETLTVSQALERYELYLAAKGNRTRSIETTMGRLRAFFPDGAIEMIDLTGKRCVALYDQVQQRPTRTRRKPTVDTHRNTLNESRTFLRWAAKRGWVQGDPMAAVEGIGRRARGKPQLRLDESRAFLSAAIVAGGPGELAAALALLMGLRASEITSLHARDVDDGGRLLWVAETAEGKTDAARRQLEAPEPLPALLDGARRAVGTGPLFPGRNRHWVLRQVRRLCRAAGVPIVCAHGLRGTHASIAQDHGATGRVVAGALGHASPAVTEAHYTTREAAQRGLAKRAALRLVR